MILHRGLPTTHHHACFVFVWLRVTCCNAGAKNGMSIRFESQRKGDLFALVRPCIACIIQRHEHDNAQPTRFARHKLLVEFSSNGKIKPFHKDMKRNVETLSPSFRNVSQTYHVVRLTCGRDSTSRYHRIA